MNTAQSSEPGSRQIHHVAVQTSHFEQSISWYTDFFGGRVSWRLDEFSELTRSRLPDILEMAEVQAGGMRFHLISRAQLDPSPSHSVAFQHVCVCLESADEVDRWRQRYQTLRASGSYEFAVDEDATKIDVDDRGVHSFYARDIDGLEFEITYDPTA